MKEIAELSGVSRGTVDRVLNHRGIVNAETERKVLEIAKLLDYQPNKAGIALAAQKKKLKIGVLLFGAENPFFDEVMDGLRQKLEELSIYGCTVIERRISFDLQSQLQTIDELLKETGDTDIVLVEGFKHEGSFPKIEVRRQAAADRPPLVREFGGRINLAAAASDFDEPDFAGVPKLDINRPEETADFIEGLALAAGAKKSAR
jgi:DNA-binding LacI/PurR family transcriptional regulator